MWSLGRQITCNNTDEALTGAEILFTPFGIKFKRRQIWSSDDAYTSRKTNRQILTFGLTHSTSRKLIKLLTGSSLAGRLDVMEPV